MLGRVTSQTSCNFVSSALSDVGTQSLQQQLWFKVYALKSVVAPHTQQTSRHAACTTPCRHSEHNHNLVCRSEVSFKNHPQTEFHAPISQPLLSHQLPNSLELCFTSYQSAKELRPCGAGFPLFIDLFCFYRHNSVHYSCRMLLLAG